MRQKWSGRDMRCRGKRPGSKLWYRRVLYAPEWSASKWNEYLLGTAVGTHLQVCCGGSFIGDVRVDVTRKAPAATVIADMLRLPFAGRSFDTVSCDPPYSLANPVRVRLQRELARVARRRIVFKAPWIPRAKGWTLRENLLTLIGSHTCASVAVLSVLDRRRLEPELFP